MEQKGEVFLDELVDLRFENGTSASYGDWCRAGGIEHYVTNESKSTTPFWKGRKDVALNTQRTYLLLDKFAEKYPDTPYIGEPACEH